MSDPLGLSVGTTNMVAARVGNPPVLRRSVLTTSGQVIAGFVERVGDPVPLVTPDGTAHHADQLVVEALSALVGDEPADQVAVAVPAHWSGATLRGLRSAMRAKPNLASNGTVPRLVPDAVAAMTALHANPGLPTDGVVVLLDFGGGGTSITLADAAASFEPLETVRHPDFSGDHLDQALLAYVLDGIADAGNVDPAGTAAVGSLGELRDECRRAKEALSEETATDVGVDLPGFSGTVRVTRAEFETLAEPGLTALLAVLDEVLQRNRIEWPDVSTIALVGGGASIPLLAQRLSEHADAPIVTATQPALDAAVGAAVFAAYAADSEAATGVAPAPLIPPELADAAPGTATFRALAWSQADDAGDDVAPYTDDDYGYDTGMTRAVAQYVPPTGPVPVNESRSWHRLPQLAFGFAAVVALVAIGGAAIALTSATDNSPPAPRPAPSSSPPPSSAPPPAPIVEEPPIPATVPSEVPPPEPPPVVQEAPPPEPAAPVTITETRVETTTMPTTTTTTTSPTTTSPTTTSPTTTSPTTTTSTTPSMTTSYITVPFVPVPIPVQVPNRGPATPTYQQPPQYQPPYQQPQFPN